MIEIDISTEIYSIKNIDKARESYKAFANIVTLPDKQKMKIQFWNCKYNEKRTVKEFENYLIGLENM